MRMIESYSLIKAGIRIPKFRYYILSLFLVYSAISANQRSDPKYDSLITAGIKQIYNIKFNEAEETFALLRNEYPKQPAGVFFDAMIVWWMIMLDFDNLSYDDLFFEKIEETIDFCDDLLDENEENVDALFFKGGALGFRGRLYSVRKDWFNAALDGKEALPLVYEAYEIDPDNNDVQLGFGIYNYYAAVIPEKYPFVKPFMIFFPSGDRDKGLEQLKSAAEMGRYSKFESKYFLLHLFFHFENDYDKAMEYAEDLAEIFPDNPTFQRYFGRCYVGRGDYLSAFRVFDSMIEKCDRNLPGYSNWIKREAAYYVGMYYKNLGETDSSMVYFTISEKLSRVLDADKEEESGFLINSLLYTGMIYLNRGEVEIARSKFEELLEMRDYNNSRATAQAFLDKLK
jgi:tetratricopeptide (TPR) repeat protein